MKRAILLLPALLVLACGSTLTPDADAAVDPERPPAGGRESGRSLRQPHDGRGVQGCWRGLRLDRGCLPGERRLPRRRLRDRRPLRDVRRREDLRRGLALRLDRARRDRRRAGAVPGRPRLHGQRILLAGAGGRQRLRAASQPLACPKDGACPPVACDCPPPPVHDGGGSSTGGGTCTCACPACAPGEACPPCKCDCGTGGGGGAVGSGGAGGGSGAGAGCGSSHGRRKRHGQRDLHLRVPDLPARRRVCAVQLQLRRGFDDDHDRQLEQHRRRKRQRERRDRHRLGAGRSDDRGAAGRLRLPGLPGWDQLPAVRLHGAAQSLHGVHGREVVRGRQGRRVRLDRASDRLLHDALPDRPVRPDEPAR